MTITKDQLQHELNEALRNCLERMKVKVHDGLEYDIGLDHEYHKLLDNFESHLKMIVKVNKQLKEDSK